MVIEKEKLNAEEIDLEGDVGARALELGPRSSQWPRYLEATLGLRNYWYPAFFSNELAEGETRAEEICGERIIFKRVNGKIYGVEDRCLHRGVAFSSRPECHTENTLTCWFHGFTYDVRDGKLVQIITEPGSSLIGKVGLATYPVHEEFMFVWVFIGDEDKLVPVDWDIPAYYIDMRRQMKDEGARFAFHPLSRAKLEGNWRDACENGTDPGHQYGHRDAEVIKRGHQMTPLVPQFPTKKDFKVINEPGMPIGLRRNATVDPNNPEPRIWEVELEGEIIKSILPDALRSNGVATPEATTRVVQRMANQRRLGGSINLPCFLVTHGADLDGWPFPFPCHHEWYVPVDEDHHMYTIMWCQKVENDEEERKFHEDVDTYWGPLIWNNSRPDQWVGEIVGFNNFDAFNRSQSWHAYANEDWHERERLYRPDMGITMWRRMVDTYARDIQTRRTNKGFAKRVEPRPPEIMYGDKPGKVRGSVKYGDPHNRDQSTF